jgi:hypothetical protein
VKHYKWQWDNEEKIRIIYDGAPSPTDSLSKVACSLAEIHEVIRFHCQEPIQGEHKGYRIHKRKIEASSSASEIV